MKSDVPLGEWLPDAPSYKAPGLLDVRNAIPSGAGYTPVLDAVGVDDSVTGTVLGAARYDKNDGTSVVIVGTSSDLFHISGGTVTASSLSLSVSTSERWQFERFNDSIYATAFGVGTYRLADIDSDTSFSSSAGSPPSARAMARVSDFLIMGNLTDTDASTQVHRLRWSAFNNPTENWVTDIATQSGFIDLREDFGPIKSIAGGFSGLVLQKFGASTIEYTGSPAVFRILPLDEQRGCASTASVVRLGPLTYWLSDSGFCRSDGGVIETISSARVWDWFIENSSATYRNVVQGAVDWVHRCIVWAFVGNTNTTNTKLLFYNWELDRWSYADLAVDYLVSDVDDGMTLEEVSAIYSDLDAMPVSLDSPEFQSQGRVLAAMVSGELSYFTGDTLEASFETGDFQPQVGRRSFVTEVWPVVESSASNARASIGTRETGNSVVTWGSFKDQGAMGFCPVVADGRLFRAKLVIPAGTAWDKAMAMQVEFTPSGRG